VHTRGQRTPRRRGIASGLVALFAAVAFLNLSGDGATATPLQPTYAGTACGSDAHASLGYCLVALSFLTGTVGYGLSAPGPAGSPLVVGKTADAGISWSSLGRVPGLVSAAPGQPHLLFTSSTTGFAWGQGNLERTTNAGTHWAKVRLRGRFLSLVRQGRSLWAATSTCSSTSPQSSPKRCGIRIAHSANGGASWLLVATPTAAFGQGELAVAGESIDLAAWEPASHHSGSGSRLLIGSARGTTWTSRPLPCTSHDQFPGELAAAPGTSTLWLACQGQADAGVALYQSSNGGSGWVKTFSASGPDGEGFALDSKLEDLQPLSATRAYALTMLHGLLVTNDGGHHWSAAASSTLTEAMSGFVGSLAVRGTRDAWVALWSTVPNHAALFHTADGGSSWLSPVLAVAPPITFPGNLPTCRTDQLEAHFSGTQGGAGSVLSFFDIADDSPTPCVLEPPASLELVNAEGTNERAIAMTMPSPVRLTAATQVPPLGSGLESGTEVATVLVTWPGIPDANSLLGGDGADVCPVPLLTPAVARMEFDGGAISVVTPTVADTAADPGIAPMDPICGWNLQAQVSVAKGS
jgi:photosystem II stability/assembly factor-like uncharacterized protein